MHTLLGGKLPALSYPLSMENTRPSNELQLQVPRPIDDSVLDGSAWKFDTVASYRYVAGLPIPKLEAYPSEKKINLSE